MKILAIPAVALSLLLSGPVFAASFEQCPEKSFGVKTVEGRYAGTDCGGDFCYTRLKLDNGEPFYAFCSEEAAKKFFGKAKGQRVVLEYEMKQFWNEPGAACAREAFCKSGHVLSGKKK